MLLRFNRNNARSYKPEQIQVFQLLRSIGLAWVDGRDQPCGVVKQSRFGILNSASFFASHGVSGEYPLSGGRAKDQARTLDKFPLGTAGIGDECGRGQCWSEFFEQRQDGANRRCEHNQVTVQNGFLDVGSTAINRTSRNGGLQHLGLVAADNRSSEPTPAKGHPE